MKIKADIVVFGEIMMFIQIISQTYPCPDESALSNHDLKFLLNRTLQM